MPASDLDLGREVQAFHSFYGDIMNGKPDRRGCGIWVCYEFDLFMEKIHILSVGYCT
jgi:hypothetical protein